MTVHHCYSFWYTRDLWNSLAPTNSLTCAACWCCVLVFAGYTTALFYTYSTSDKVTLRPDCEYACMKLPL